MIKKIIIVIIGFFTSVTLSQNKINKNHLPVGLTCKTCHSCEVPTRRDPCLNSCPRTEMTTINQTPEESPEIEILKELSKQYSPVVFLHRAHARMSEISGGCQICHHYNTIGSIQPCINCHQTKRKRTNINKPDLEAAYHQQCINCHRAWSHTIDCTSCHALKNANESETINSSIKKMTGKIHPEIKVPEKLIFETNYIKGKLVTFYHDEHINLFGAKCLSCHKQHTCTQCHDKEKANIVEEAAKGIPIKIHKVEEQHHTPCFSCHKDDKCNVCHQDKPTGPFNHAVVTGWALNRFHEKLQCSKCHGNVKKFAKLKTECTSCHNNFAQGKFDHSITGLKLDENHSGFECENCHENKDFTKPPLCSPCHDNKSFPKDKPGKIVDNLLIKNVKLSK